MRETLIASRSEELHDWDAIHNLIQCQYTAASINRHSACTDTLSLKRSTTPHDDNWLAFGSNEAVCLAQSDEAQSWRVVRLLPGHSALVVCVRWLDPIPTSPSSTESHVFLSSADSEGSVIIWSSALSSLVNEPWRCRGGDWLRLFTVQLPNAMTPTALDGFWVSVVGDETHSRSVIFSVTADTELHSWSLQLSGSDSLTLDQDAVQHTVVRTSPHLCLCLRTLYHSLTVSNSAGGLHMAIIGLDNGMTEIWSQWLPQDIAADTSNTGWIRSIRLSGHTNWVRCVDICTDRTERGCDLSVFLATGSQDNVIRLWRIQNERNKELDAEMFKVSHLVLPDVIDCKMFSLSAISESVLSGHDNWITGLCWASSSERFPPPLLSASMDKSLIVWSPPSKSESNSDMGADLWLENTRLGNLGGTSLGFLGCFWSPSDATAVYGQHFQGSLSVWRSTTTTDSIWHPGLPLCGHAGRITDLTWAKHSTLKTSPKCDQGRILLTVSSDQTVRAHVPYQRNDSIKRSEKSCPDSMKAVSTQWWQEIARPQVHGYDMNAIASLSTTSYISAGDEKVARVFCATRTFVKSYTQSTGCAEFPFADGDSPSELLAKEAVQPTLGLSNQVVTSSTSGDTAIDGADAITNSLPSEGGLVNGNADCEMNVPIPTEDRLQNCTLWPETKKLYGHAYEVYALAAHPHRLLVASTCVASSQTHAYIILWNGYADWSVHQRLMHHQLTVTRMTWNHCGSQLLAVSRDRTWSCWSEMDVNDGNNAEPGKLPHYQLTAYPRKGQGHTRIIWTAAWSPDDRYFLTGSRDKSVLIWPAPTITTIKNESTLPEGHSPIGERKTLPDAITAMDVCWLDKSSRAYLVAIGLESGNVMLLFFTNTTDGKCTWIAKAPLRIPRPWSHLPGKQVRRVSFNTPPSNDNEQRVHLATGADDGIVHVFDVEITRLWDQLK